MKLPPWLVHFVCAVVWASAFFCAVFSLEFYSVAKTLVSPYVTMGMVFYLMCRSTISNIMMHQVMNVSNDVVSKASLYMVLTCFELNITLVRLTQTSPIPLIINQLYTWFCNFGMLGLAWAVMPENNSWQWWFNQLNALHGAYEMTHFVVVACVLMSIAANVLSAYSSISGMLDTEHKVLVSNKLEQKQACLKAQDHFVQPSRVVGYSLLPSTCVASWIFDVKALALAVMKHADKQKNWFTLEVHVPFTVLITMCLAYAYASIKKDQHRRRVLNKEICNVVEQQMNAAIRVANNQVPHSGLAQGYEKIQKLFKIHSAEEKCGLAMAEVLNFDKNEIDNFRFTQIFHFISSLSADTKNSLLKTLQDIKWHWFIAKEDLPKHNLLGLYLPLLIKSLQHCCLQEKILMRDIYVNNHYGHIWAIAVVCLCPWILFQDNYLLSVPIAAFVGWDSYFHENGVDVSDWNTPYLNKGTLLLSPRRKHDGDGGGGPKVSDGDGKVSVGDGGGPEVPVGGGGGPEVSVGGGGGPEVSVGGGGGGVSDGADTTGRFGGGFTFGDTKTKKKSIYNKEVQSNRPSLFNVQGLRCLEQQKKMNENHKLMQQVGILSGADLMQ